MAIKKRQITKQTNIFDGQRINEKDLSTDQIHYNALASNLVLDFHGSGVVQDAPFTDLILLDTRNPGLYSATENPSKTDLQSGTYDGKGISLDRQVSDPIRGNRLEFELVSADVKGRNKVKLLVLGKVFNGIDSAGNLNLEFIEFDENSKKVSQNFYTSVIAVFFNNFSGGTGKTELVSSQNSLDLITDTGGYLIVREAPGLSIYPFTKTAFQIESPNYDLIHFITSSNARSISDEIEIALGSSNSINDLYLELDGKAQLEFAQNAATSIAYGQKFLSQVDNIQKVDLLLSVERDDSLGVGHEFDFSGDLVVSIHELISEVNCPTDAIPDNLIDFDPDITPLVEASFNQDDLELLGHQLTDVPQVVSFNFAGTLIADPNLEPSVQKNKYYAIQVTRRGDNRKGKVLLEQGYDKVDRKTDLNIPLTVLEQFGKQQSKFVEFDPVTKRYINDSQSSLWYIIHTDAVEVTDGTAYADTGVAVTVEKTEGFVGDTEISHFVNNLTLRTVAEDADNYLILSQVEKFLDPGIHPRTGNRVFTRTLNVPEFSVVNADELSNLMEDTTPLIIAKINDHNVRDAQTLTGTLSEPGLIGPDYVILIDPGNEILSSNLINRIITPDTGCDCNSRYRIARVDCEVVKAGDFNNDGQLSSSDLGSILDVVGQTINSITTERDIFNGDLNIIDFIKADLNQDGTVDGLDIELLENAVDGYVNFTVGAEFKVIYLRLENILASSDYPTIFTDTGSSGSTTTASASLTFVAGTENQALAIRAGDTVVIPSTSVDAGTFSVKTKSIAADHLTVTLTVEDLTGATPAFTGDSGFNIVIESGTAVNIYADNSTLLNLPFESKNYEIAFIDAPFQGQFIDICDLRRNVASTFLELESESCQCVEESCTTNASDCSPVYKNQYYFPGDLYLPNGNILTAPGIPHPGDFEYTTIKLPLPPGSITDCSLNLYTNFIKSKDGTCLTAAGFPAMKYSDGSLVGCEDQETDTDITKGRVKFDHKLSSVFVDSLTDGYVDGYTVATTSETDQNVEFITENFIQYSYTGFSTWNEDGLNDTTVSSITHTSGINSPAIFSLTTSSDSGSRFGRLNAPSEISGITGDFIIDFTAARTAWDATSLTNGTVSAFFTTIITNDDGGISTLKLGWKVVGGYETKLFYSGVIENASSVVISTFAYEIDAPDDLTDVVEFRLRRINDVVSAYYIIPEKLVESTLNTFGQYVKIGENPEVQPGDGSVEMSFEVAQDNAPTPGLLFYAKLINFDIKSEYSSADDATSATISRSTSSHEVNRIIVTFPFNLPRRTVLESVSLVINSLTTDTISGLFRITPLTLINADNLGKVANVPIETDSDLITSFSPGTIIADSSFDVNVTTAFSNLLAEAGQIPGFLRGFIIEPEATTDSSFDLTSTLSVIFNFEDASTGIVFKVGVTIDPSTGIATFNTKNILYDNLNEASRTIITFGVYLKKAGFKNEEVDLTINDLSRLGTGSCFDSQIIEQDGECFFIAGTSDTGVILEGPIPCDLNT